MAQKTVLIVFAHQSPGSFNAAARDVSVKALTDQGYKVIVSDLYAMNFRANATREDVIGDLKNPELFQYGDETMHAWMEQRLSEDIVAEQRKVEEAELIIFQFPLYWFSVPAIMKGWMDRVLTQGFAFSLEKMYNNGIFKDKKAMLSFSTGAIQTMFRPDGVNGDINVTLWPLQNGILHFCGFQVLAPQVFWCPAHSPPVARTAMLEGWRARLKGLSAEKPLTFAPCELFDLSFKGGFLLRQEVREEYSLHPHGITTGHHLGKPLPPDNQMKTVHTEDAPPGQTVHTEDAPPGQTVHTEDAPPGQTVHKEDAPPGQTVHTEDAPPGQTVHTEDVPPGQTVHTEDVPPGQTVHTEDAPPGQTVHTEDAPPGQTVHTEDAPPGQTVHTEDVPPGQTVHTEDAPPGQTVHTEDAPPEQTVHTEDAPPGQTVHTEDAPPGQTVHTEDAPPEQTVHTEDAPPGQTVHTEDAPPGQTAEGNKGFSCK